MKAWKHFKTITFHKWLVMKSCFAVGLYGQGLLHDLSKYSKTEFLVGVRYFQGNRSPNNAERETLGYSAAWLHHKGRNKHHYEYWVDYSLQGGRGVLAPVPMPDRYIAEMLMDRVAACKVYMGSQYTDKAPLEYYLKGKYPEQMHDRTRERLEMYLRMLADQGEKSTFAWIKKNWKVSHY